MTDSMQSRMVEISTQTTKNSMFEGTTSTKTTIRTKGKGRATQTNATTTGT